MPKAKSDIGLIGLAVMGQNLVLNMADHGYTVSVFNRTTSKTDAFIADCEKNEPSAERVVGFAQLKDFVKSIAKPRKIILLVKSTAVLPNDRDAVDATIAGLLPLIDKSDIIPLVRADHGGHPFPLVFLAVRPAEKYARPGQAGVHGAEQRPGGSFAGGCGPCQR